VAYSSLTHGEVPAVTTALAIGKKRDGAAALEPGPVAKPPNPSKPKKRQFLMIFL